MIRKICLLLIVFSFFLVPSVFADFSVSDSLNLSNCSSRLQSIDGRLGTLQNTVTSINTNTTSISSTVSACNTELALINSELDTIRTYLTYVEADTTDLVNYCNTLTTRATSIDNKLTDINNKLADLLLAINSGNQNIVDNIDSGNQIAQDTQDFVTNETITDSNMEVDTSEMEVTDTNDVHGFIGDVLNELLVFFNGISESTVYSIEIPMPYGLDSIILQSDMISKNIRGTILYSLIQTMWSFVFGTYLVFYVRHIINFFSSGEFDDTSLAYFLEHLENNDVIIRSTMM